MKEGQLAIRKLSSLSKNPATPASPNAPCWRSTSTCACAAWAGYFGDPQLALQAVRELPSLYGNAFNLIVWRPVQSDMRLLSGFRQLMKEWGLVDFGRATGNWGEHCRLCGGDDLYCDIGVGER